MSSRKTAALLVGFGGPTSPEEVRPFLQSVLEGVRIPPERFEEVLGHYEVVGGVSLYNAVTERQRQALERELKATAASMPVGAAYRHSTPGFRDAFETYKKYGVERVIGFVLSPFRCYASFEKYVERVEAAKLEAGAASIETVYTPDFGGHPLFLKAQVGCVSELLRLVPKIERSESLFIFSAHSVPVSMAGAQGYAQQFETISASIAQTLNLPHWTLAYQSRSGNPRDPWLEPDVQKKVDDLDPGRWRNVVLVTPGFLCDNVEVVYDLDVELKQRCDERGIGYFRAPTVADHPDLIHMMAQQVLEAHRS